MKLFKISVNVQNLTDHRYFQTGNSTNVIFPGSPINAMTEFQVRF